MKVFLILLSYSPRHIFASIHTNLEYCFSTFGTVKIWYHTVKILLSKYVDNIKNTVSILLSKYVDNIRNTVSILLSKYVDNIRNTISILLSKYIDNIILFYFIFIFWWSISREGMAFGL